MTLKRKHFACKVDDNIQHSTKQLKHLRQHSTPFLRVPTANRLNVMQCNCFAATTTQFSLFKMHNAAISISTQIMNAAYKSSRTYFNSVKLLICKQQLSTSWQFLFNGPTPRLTKRPKPQADSCSVSLQRLNSMNHEASEPSVYP
jgi:hypothetical protein